MQRSFARSMQAQALAPVGARSASTLLSRTLLSRTLLLGVLLVAAPGCPKKAEQRDAGAGAQASVSDGGLVARPGWRQRLASSDPVARAEACLSILPSEFGAPPPELLAALGDADARVRGAAIKGVLGFILQFSDASALPKLLEVAGRDAVVELRGAAVRALGTLSHRDAVPGLVALFPGEKDERVRDELLAVLGREGDQRALPLLLPLLKEKYPLPAVFDALRRLGDPRAAPALLPLLDHESGAIRSHAIEVLGALGSQLAAPKLVAALTDKNTGIVREAIKAVALLGVPEAVVVLVKLVDAPEPRTRLLAIRALGSFRNPEAIRVSDAFPPVARRLEKDTDEVRIEAARALGTMKVEAAIPVLSAAAAASEPLAVRRAAIDALGFIGQAAALKVLVPALLEKDAELRAGAARAIGHLGAAGVGASGVLREACKRGEADIDARVEYVRALGLLGDPGSAATLLEAGEKDAVPPVRAEAGGALLRLGDARGLRVLRPILFGATDWQERRAAARAIDISSRVPGLASLVSEALDAEKEPLVREALYRVLGDATGEPAKQFQRKALAEKVPAFRLMAADGLCGNGDASGCQVLLAALREPEASVRAEAARRLGELKLAVALPALRAAADDPVVAVVNAARRAGQRIEAAASGRAVGADGGAGPRAAAGK